MTTLPQTTGIRLPRPTAIGPQGGTVLAAPHVGGAASGVVGMTAADIWRVLRANAWLIIALVMVSTVLGYGVNKYLSMYHSRYTAWGYVGVEPTRRFDPLHPNAND